MRYRGIQLYDNQYKTFIRILYMVSIGFCWYTLINQLITVLDNNPLLTYVLQNIRIHLKGDDLMKNTEVFTV